MITLDDLSQELWPLASQVALESEVVPLNMALGRVLTEDIQSLINVPQHDNSAMDGYAVRCADFATQQSFGVSQRVAAGDSPQPLQAGSVARIFTGAPIPEGADAVIMQEEAQLLDDSEEVTFLSTPAPEQWIRRAGDDIRQGETVLHSGARLGPIDIGLLASIGIAEVKVRRRLRIGLLITGSELQSPGKPLGSGQIYNSNEFVWRALLQQLGAEVKSTGIVKDDRLATIEALGGLAEDCDLVLSSGGVSVGEEDHVKPAVETLGKLRSWKISMKPGKPVAFGELNGPKSQPVWFFGLPGNPVSSAVTFLLLVKPFMDLMQGRPLLNADWRSRISEQPMKAAWLKPDSRREEFLRATLTDAGVELFHNQSSGVLTSMSRSNGLVRVPKGQPLAAGDKAQFISYDSLMS